MLEVASTPPNKDALTSSSETTSGVEETGPPGSKRDPATTVAVAVAPKRGQISRTAFLFPNPSFTARDAVGSVTHR